MAAAGAPAITPTKVRIAMTCQVAVAKPNKVHRQPISSFCTARVAMQGV